MTRQRSITRQLLQIDIEMLKSFFKKYIVDALGHMAKGLFCSLILGLIIGQIAKIPGLGFLTFIAEALSVSSPLVGACIGLAIAIGMKCAQLTTISAAITGALGYRSEVRSEHISP